MRIKCAALAAGFLSALFLCGQTANAGTVQIAIAVNQKKEAGDKKRSGNVTQEETLYQYTVTLTNKSFAPVSGLSAQYRIFVRDDSGKGAVSKQKLKRNEFTATVPDMPNGGTYSFDTEGVTLQKASLDGGWHYTDGTRSRSADRIAGVWIRIFQGDKIVGEYVNPSTIATKEKF
ncbi:MAG: hypothetical protein ACREKL_08135 [Chthoniobacterales bacterium]